MSELGVRIKIDFSDVNRLKDAVKDKINIDVDQKEAMKKIDKLEKQIKQLNDKKIDLDINSRDVMGVLNDVEGKINEIAKGLSKGMDLKINLDVSNFEDQMKTKAKEIDRAVRDTSKAFLGSTAFKNVNADRIVKKYKLTDDGLEATGSTTFTKSGKRYTIDGYGNMSEISNRVGSLKEIAKLMKDINNLKIKQMDYDKSDIEYDAYAQRIKSLNGMKGALVRDYNNMYKGDYTQDTIIKQVQSVNELNLALKQGAKAREAQKNYDKETADMLKDYVSLLNEQQSLFKKAENSGYDTQQGRVYADQAKSLDEVIQKKNELYQLDKRLSTAQKDSLQSMMSDNKAELDFIKRLNEAKDTDRVSKENYSQLKAELKEIYDLETKISELKAKENASVITGKEESKLKQLEAELQISKQLHEQNKKNLDISESQARAYKDYETKRKSSLDKSSQIARERAELKKIDDAYDEIAASMKKVNSYYGQMERAGDNEAATLRKLISLEEQRQEEIRKTNDLKNRGNDAREGELRTQQRINDEAREESELIRQARQQDRYIEGVSAYSSLSDLINPRQVFQEFKQAALYMYEEVKAVEDNIVNIAKVIEPSEIQGLETFRKEIYDTASSVGKSAEEYAVSVERWASSGKTLQEAIDLGKKSTIGAFVGNVDEAAMVDYMSVPLIAFKKHGLEATDIINSMNEVANNNAIEMDDLGKAYQRSAGTAAQAGTSFDKLTGLITAAQETTRLGGETIGTALRAFDVNLGKIGARLTKQDSKKFDFFKDIGVDLVDTNGEMRSTYDIIGDLEARWGSLTSEQRNTAGFYAAGKQYQNILTSIINGWEYVEKARQDAQGQLGLGEAGSAYDEFAVQQDSLEFKQAALKNSWSEFINEVSGGKETFSTAMDVMTSGLQRFTEYAKDPNIRNLGKGALSLGGGLTSMVAFSTGAKVLSKGLKATLFPLKQVVGGMGYLGKSSMITKVVSGASKVTGALSLTAAGLTIVDAGLRAFTGEGLVEKAARGFSHIYDTIHAGETDIKTFNQSYEATMQTLRNNNAIRSAIKSFDQLYTSYQKLYDEKLEKYKVTDSLVDLSLTEEEFEKIRTQHNELVKELGLGAEFEIKFNNHQHIMNQMQEVNAELDKIDERTRLSDWQAINKPFKESTAPQLEEDKQIYLSAQQAFKNAIDPTTGEIDPKKVRNSPYAQYDRNAGYKSDQELVSLFESNINQQKERYRANLKKQLELISENTELLDKQDANIEKLWDEAGKNLREAINSKGYKEALKNRFDKNKTTEEGYLFAVQEVAKASQELEGSQKSLQNSQDIYGKYKKDAISASDAINQLSTELENNEMLFESATIKDWISENGLGSNLNFESILNDGELAREFFETILPRAAKEAKEKIIDIQSAIKKLGDDFGIPIEQTEKLLELYNNDRSEFFKKAFEINEEAAQNYAGLNGKEMYQLELMSLDYNISTGDIISDIQKQVEQLDGTIAGEKFDIKLDAEGNADFSQILDQIQQFTNIDPELIVRMGVVQDGELNILQLYSILDQLGNEDVATELKLNVDSQSGLVEMSSFLEKLQSGEIEIQFDPKTGIRKVVNAWEGTEFELNPVPKNASDFTSKLESEVGEVKIQATYDVNGKFGKNSNINAQQYWDETVQQIVAGVSNNEVDVPLELVPKITNADGSANLEGIADLITHNLQKEFTTFGGGEPITLETAIRQELNLDESEPLTMDEITAYLNSIYQSGDEGRQYELETLIKILTRTEVQESGDPVGEAEAAAGEQAAEIDEVEENASPTVTVTPKVVNEDVDLSLPSYVTENTTSTIDIGVSADTSNFDSQVATINTSIDEVSGKTAKPTFDGDSMPYNMVANSVSDSVSVLNQKKATISILGDARPFYNTLAAVKAASASITVSIRGKSSGKSASVGTNLGRSLSASIGQGIASLGKSQSAAIGKSLSKASEPAKVNEDVWRYWAKELFEGIPLENALNKLSDQIQKSDDNEAQLIKLYKEQISVTKEQIAYEKSMQKAQQAELTSIISKLSGYGFRASGNRITNLDNAKSLSGDRASEAEKLLNDWKKLYESINSIDKKVADLQMDNYKAEKDIKEALESKELKEIEKTLKRSEAILKSVENNTNIQDTREDLVDNHDLELSMDIQAGGLRNATSNIAQLVDEFNRLSVTYVEHEKSGKEVQSVLDDLRDKILSNADAIIEYKNNIDSLAIQKLTDDYDRFSNAVSINTDRVSANVDALRGGLLNGNKLSDLMSSQFTDLDLTRKTGFERYQEERIKLEDDLNKILDEYAQINVDRTKKVASNVLTIEKNKYAQLLNLATTYQNGGLAEISENVALKSIEKVNNLANKQSASHVAWQQKLLAFHSLYAQQYEAMSQQYDNTMAMYSDGATKTMLTNEMILKQLSMQEEMYRGVIDINKQSISQAKELLNNSSLQTEKRRELLDMITEYEESSIEAEKRIREIVQSRYEFQFELIDKEMGKVKRYSQQLDYLLEVAELVNVTTNGATPIYKAIYGAKMSEYTKAKQALSSLVKEQQKFTEGSLEWNNLDSKIKNIQESLNDFTLDVLNANRNLLGNEIDFIKEKFEDGLFDGKTLEEWREFREDWVTGISKEFALEDLRKRLLEVEDETIEKRLSALDLQDKVSQKDLDYLDKQMKVIELRNKLSNIEGERKVQELVRGDDGKWAFAYVADQSEYDKTYKELNDAEKDLDNFRKDQKTKYGEAIGAILNKAGKGEYRTADELAADINRVNALYGMVAMDDPTLSQLSTGEIVAKYQEYLANNGMMVGDSLSGGLTTSPMVQSIGSQIETSFLNISYDLGRIIGEEVRKALLNPKGGELAGNSYYISSLEFPNVTDPTGFQEVLEGLATVAKQEVMKKG